MSAQTVDVLAIMDRAANSLLDYAPAIDEMVCASDAVRELIEAADELRRALGTAVCSWPVSSGKRMAYARTDAALRMACGGDRYNGTTSAAVDAALARCKGGAA